MRGGLDLVHRGETGHYLLFASSLDNSPSAVLVRLSSIRVTMAKLLAFDHVDVMSRGLACLLTSFLTYLLHVGHLSHKEGQGAEAVVVIGRPLVGVGRQLAIGQRVDVQGRFLRGQLVTALALVVGLDGPALGAPATQSVAAKCAVRNCHRAILSQKLEVGRASSVKLSYPL